jgi:hypothetical protein
MILDTALLCRGSRRRDVLQTTNSQREEPQRFNGVEYVEFEEADRFDRILVNFLCPLSGSELPGVMLWDETLRTEVSINPPQKLGAKRVRITPTTPLCAGRSYRLNLRQCQTADPQFATYRFTTTGNTLDVDPKAQPTCAPRKQLEPQPNYLARDFGSFRQLLFDRMALLMPQWKERHVPDLGVTLIELLAYVGDYLSYFQDAVGTEAYLHTARQRVSVRRHARLVDYQLNEGCNARTFVQINVAPSEMRIDADDVFFITEHPDSKLAEEVVLNEVALERLPPGSFQPFEIMRLPDLPSTLSSSDVKAPIGLIHYLAGDEAAADQATRKLGAVLSAASPAELLERLRAYARSDGQGSLDELVQELIDALNNTLDQCSLHDKLGVPRPAKIHCGCAADGSGRSIPQENADLLRVTLRDYLASQGDRRRSLFAAHNCIAFYTWDQRECCLPIGATRATLRDNPCSSETLQTLKLPDNEQLVQGDDSNLNPIPAAAPSRNDPCDILCTNSPNEWRLKNLSPGDVLIFEEIRGPQTHEPGDADPAHRQAVRLTCVRHCRDPITDTRIVEIEWDAADALRFPLCISSIGPAVNGCEHNSEISVARGNVLLADHGRSLTTTEFLGISDYGTAEPTCRPSDVAAGPVAPPRSKLLRPVLKESDLTFAARLPAKWSAADAGQQNVADALPTIEVFGLPRAVEPVDAFREPHVPPPTLISIDDLASPLDLFRRYANFQLEEQRRIETMLSPEAARFLQHHSDPVRLRELSSIVAESVNGPDEPPQGANDLARLRQKSEFDDFAHALRQAVEWHPKAHLLSSGPDDQDVVVEVDDERRARLRFGNDELGCRPAAGLSFLARYRRGNGIAGNVGANALKHAVFRRESLAGLVSIRNPLPADGGREPEAVEHAKWHAPHAFKQLQRAIRAEDYAELVRRDFRRRVQQTRASLHWTGSFYEVDIAVDPVSAEADLLALLQEIENYLQRYRRIGHRVRVRPPLYVGLQIDMVVCVESGYLRAHVRRELLERFSNRTLPEGSQGFFHPDKFTFGDALYVSRIIREAKRIDGVENIDVTRFERYGHGDAGELAAGVMRFGPLEIPRLDSDCQRPEFGRFCLDVRGLR